MRYGLTLLKGLAAFGVVGCHLFLAPVTQCADKALHYCDLSVAVFGAVSGYLLLLSFDEKIKCPDFSLRRLILHRAWRILPAYFFWTGVFLVASPILNVLVRHETLDERYLTVAFWCSAILRGGSSTHLWYLAHLFWWSLLLYALWGVSFRVFAHWISMLLLAFASLGVCVGVGGEFCDYGLRLLAFMSLGGALARLNPVLSLVKKSSWIVLIVVSLALHWVLPAHAYIRDFIVVVVLVPFFARDDWSHSRLCGIIGANSFGVYLVHPLITMAFSIGCKHLFGSPIGLPVLVMDWLIVFWISLLLSWVLRTNCYTRWSVT